VALAVAAVAVILPFVPGINSVMGFVPVPAALLGVTGRSWSPTWRRRRW
jgi:hypothetical protein